MPLGVDRYIVHVEANTQGTPNEALVHFDVNMGSTLTDAERLACMIAYLSGVGDVAVSTIITQAEVIRSGAAGALPLPFPVAAYAAWKAVNSHLVTMAGYGVTYGSGVMATLGTSITVSLYTAIPGRATTGRHYRPWTGAGALDSGGEVAGAYVSGIDEAYNCCFNGIDGSTWTHVTGKFQQLSVWSATAGTHVILTPRTSQVPSRLRSRTR